YLNGTPDTGGVWTPTLPTDGIFDPATDSGGVYTYTIEDSVCGDQSSVLTVTVSSDSSAGEFTGTQDICNTLPEFDLTTLLDGSQQAGGVWTDNNGEEVSNPIQVSTLPLGVHFYTYTVANGCGTDSETVYFTLIEGSSLDIEDIDVTTPVCQGQPVVITIYNLNDGDYTLVYSLSGANTVNNQSISFTVVDAEVSFEIDAALLTNAGTTIITMETITNLSTNCTTNLDITLEIEIIAAPEINKVNISIEDVCLGSDVLVEINDASDLPDGDYIFSYHIPNGNPPNLSSAVSIVSGNGSFTVPAAVFEEAGTYSLTINGITNQDTSCINMEENATAYFEVLDVPENQLAGLSVNPGCFGDDVVVNISEVSALSDGAYELIYELSGANTALETVTVNITSGEGNFIIPAGLLINQGTTTLSIQPIVLTGNICGTAELTFPVLDFSQEIVSTPELIQSGNEFCEEDNPTIANLNNNINGQENIIWYDAPENGNILSDNESLVDGQTYYASLINENLCESNVRLEVTVVIEICEELDVIIPDGFSPNNDGINDYFVIKNIRELYPNFTIEIYNRYGNILFEGDAQLPDWDGSTKNGVQIGGNRVPTGVYFYILNFNDGIRKPVQGRLYLSR
ncbi:MAG: gliding motility-associated C-terminal domain-containing protein, partial [Flavobacteriaceae bacterium]|nr:gliding motility-associated C-terminal domain-containing protein [Flavobacteriaceae bacterium]